MMGELAAKLNENNPQRLRERIAELTNIATIRLGDLRASEAEVKRLRE